MISKEDQEFAQKVVERWEAEQPLIEKKRKEDAAYRSSVREFTGAIYISPSRGGMGDNPASFNVMVAAPDDFWADDYRWDLKKGIVDQFHGKKVTVIVHD